MTGDMQEFNARTVDEAVQKASASLGVDPGDLSYKVLDTGSSGFMGLGARDARISVETGASAVEEAPSGSPLPPRRAPEQTPEANGGEPAPGPVPEADEVSETGRRAVPSELLEEVRAFMARVVETMELDARVDVYDAGEVVAVDVATEQTGLFIGQKGETIDALQYLLNVALYKNREFSKRIVIDCEGYRQRRVEAIQGIAHRMARRALRERRTVELPPMNPSERRIVHLYLKKDERVVTASEGAGESRRVKVTPV